jgi:carboxyl-terminal processing protease
MESLIDEGCEKFVFDVRGNLGGELKSIVGVLSYLLDEGDLIITTEWNSGKRDEYFAEERMYTDTYENCSVSSDDVGKYLGRGFEFAVLCDGMTASAAEVFVSNFRDHNIGVTVGTATYGKGVVQTLYNLNAYGFPGGLRITNRMYYPPSGVGYDGIGITPDKVVEYTEKMLTTSIYELEDADDVQLVAAIEHFSK